MNSKKVNWIFLLIVCMHIGVVALMFFLPLLLHDYAFELPIVLNFIASQGIILVPALLVVLISKENLFRLAGFRKIKFSTVLKVILFTFLSMPLTSLINMVSMLFVDNTVAAISGDVLAVSFPVMLFIIGIFGPFSEELVFRGIIYQGYKKSGTVFGAMILSALLFALMHMNFNQAAYTFVVGMLVVLLVEATGSLWSSMLFHMFFNSQQVCIMYLYDTAGLLENGLEESQEVLTTDVLLAAISIMLIVAATATALAFCVLAWIAKGEHRENALRAVWRSREKGEAGENGKNEKEEEESAVRKNRMVTAPLIIGIVLALSYMCFELWLTYLLV